MLTCPWNLDPLKPHFYTVKLEITGVHSIFHNLLVRTRTASVGQMEGVPTNYVLSKDNKNINFSSDNFQF